MKEYRIVLDYNGKQKVLETATRTLDTMHGKDDEDALMYILRRLCSKKYSTYPKGSLRVQVRDVSPWENAIEGFSRKWRLNEQERLFNFEYLCEGTDRYSKKSI